MSMQLGSGGTYIVDNTVTLAKLCDASVDGYKAMPTFQHTPCAEVDNTVVGYTQGVVGTGSVAEDRVNGVVKLTTGGAGRAKVYGFQEAAPTAMNTTVWTEVQIKVGTTAFSGAADYILFALQDQGATRTVALQVVGNAPTVGQLVTLDGTGSSTTAGKATIALAAWHTYRVEASAGAARWYVDGVLQETTALKVPVDTGLPSMIYVEGGNNFNYQFRNLKWGVVRA
jgi:hypothetical protein